VVFDSLTARAVQPSGTGHIEPSAATEVLTELISTKTMPVLSSGSSNRILIDGTVFTPAVDSVAEVTVQFSGQTALGTAWGTPEAGVACVPTASLTTFGAHWTFTVAGVTQGATSAPTAQTPFTLAGRFNVSAGTQYRAGLYIFGAVGQVFQCDTAPRVQVTLIKR
jgi:hypothetical protein